MILFLSVGDPLVDCYKGSLGNRQKCCLEIKVYGTLYHRSLSFSAYKVSMVVNTK